LRPEEINAKALIQANNDRYLLTVAVNKRVDELYKGAKPFIDADPKKVKLVDIAIKEIAEGHITIKVG
jgi:DNA-directed RNA polymerase subunit omega